MNTAEILRGLLRRWYVLVPAVLLSVALGFVTWANVDPSYERSGRQLLLPGTTSIPEGGNPYLYVGGLSQAADVVVLALGSNNVLDEIAKEYPQAQVAVSRDTSTSSPVIVITVTAPTDAEAADVLEIMVDRTATVLTDLQDQEQITGDNRISVNTVTVDGQSVLQQKDRLIAAAGVGAAGVVVSILIASVVDGLVVSRRRRSRSSRQRTERVPEEAEVESHRSRVGSDDTHAATDRAVDEEPADPDDDDAVDSDHREDDSSATGDEETADSDGLTADAHLAVVVEGGAAPEVVSRRGSSK